MSSIAILATLAAGPVMIALALGSIAKQELRELFAPVDRR
jgi:hypothetical protein